MELINFDKFKEEKKEVKLFFGEYDGIQRYDRYKYTIMEKLVKAQRTATWFPTEINFSKDRASFSMLSQGHQDIYKANLLFQTLADSLANRFLDNVLSQYVTAPELEAVLKWQAHFELIHSESYSWNIREVFGDPEKFFNEGFQDKNIQSRLDLELKSYQDLEDVMNGDNLIDKKKAILEVCFRQNALENVRFFVSFLYNFKLNDLNEQVLQGTMNNIKLILNDEIIHTTIFRHLLNILRTQEHEGFTDIFEEMKDKAIRIFEEVIDSEIKWFEYLSSFEEIEGFTEDNVRDFLEYYASTALNHINIDNDFNTKQNDLVNFFESKKNLNNSKTQAQESQLLTYNIASLDNLNYQSKSVDSEVNITISKFLGDI